MTRRVLIVLAVVAVLADGDWALPTECEPAPAGPGAAGPTGIPGGATAATVEYVHDGDTIFLDDGRKVRLLGVDTPEIGEDAQCWGGEATSATRALLPEGAAVWVLADADPLDQYGRALLFVFLPDGTNVNLELVAEGHARVEQYAPNWLYRDELRAAQTAAERDDLGMWGAC